MLVFDIESNGLLDTITTVHCINVIDTLTNQRLRFTDHVYYQDTLGRETMKCTPRHGTILDGLRLLTRADSIGGHNILGYDVPALEQMYPDDTQWAEGQQQFDSMVWAQLAYPDLKSMDWAKIRAGTMPDTFRPYAGRNTLFSWGLRLGGEAKSDFTPADFGHTWSTIPFIEEMDEYCMQDVAANVALFDHLRLKDVAPRAVKLEMDTARIIRLQERTGVRFDEAGADHLARTLYERQAELQVECEQSFPPFYVKDGRTFTPKRDNAKLGYVAGAPMQKVTLTQFNPSSNAHVELNLRRKYGWEPTEFTDTGLATINEDVLSALPFPEAKLIGEYKMVTKRLSQLCEGKQAWMKKVANDGRIYGRVNQLGCVTGRMAHHSPNLGQVPANGKPYGEDCRSLFLADAGRSLVGCDADAIELRILAHYMARFDSGAYVDVVLNGDKDSGTDMHTRNQRACGFTDRGTAKEFFYAMLYGAGNWKLGTIVMGDWDVGKLTRFYSQFPPGNARKSRIVKLGSKARGALMDGLPALKALTKVVGKAAKRGYLKGLDGRKIPVRSQHAALNSLCQSAGAVLMKEALVIMFGDFKQAGLDVQPLLNVHDEVQLSAVPEEADHVGRIAAQAIAKAGESFTLRCPLGGNYDVGNSWAETH